ncbi:MAG TPA: hypothetical protein VN442_07750 [Bryobacteraceae bacterium]|nr:hypothetical protein [Bryobacteraceae bacterium]
MPAPPPPPLSPDDPALPVVLDELEAPDDDDDDDDDVEDREDEDEEDDEDDELNRFVLVRLELELPGTTAGLELLPPEESSPDEVAWLLVVDTLDEPELPVGCATRLGLDIGVLAV